ncbi:retrovirus-related pol polyprotein from transposon TNT 1-94 [Tanacetum coccineum]
MEPIHTPVVDPSGTGEVDETQSTRLRYRSMTKNEGKTSSELEPNTEHLQLQTFADIQAFLLSEDELDKESDEEEVLAAGDDMDEDPQDNAEVKTPSLDQTQPEPSHASIDQYYDKNIAHREQTDKLVEASMGSLDRRSTTISDLYKGLIVITELLKDINNAVKDDIATNKKIYEAIKTFAKISTQTIEILSLVKTFDFSTLQATMQDLQAHALKQEEVSASWTKCFINLAWNLGSRITAVEISQTALKRSVTPTLSLTYIPAIVEGENATTTATDEPPSHTEGEIGDTTMAIPISSIQPTHDQQITPHEVLKREHSKKVKLLTKLNRRRAEEYMWTMTNRIKHEGISDVRIHPNTKPIVASVFRDNDKRNFNVHQPIKFLDFGIIELDELGPIIQKKKNFVVKDMMTSLRKRYERLNKILKELGIQSGLPAPAFQRWDDIHKVRVDSLVSYLVMALMVKTKKNARFSLKLRKMIVDHLDQDKLKSKKVKLEALGYVRDTCPDIHIPSKKLVDVMPINKKKTVRFAEHVMSSSTSQKQLGSSQTQTTNNFVLTSTGVSRSTKSSTSKSTDNTKNDRILQISSSTQKKNKVEYYSRIVKSCLNKPNCIVEPSGNANVQHSKLNTNFELMCVKCNSFMFDARHELCFLEFISDMNASSKSKSVKKAKKKEEWKPTGKVIQIVLWYLDSRCSKHMIGDRSQLTNFVHKFLGTVKFSNNQIAKIMGYGDYQIGNIKIPRVYYVERPGHNLFSVGQFCNSNLELAFRKHTCFVCNLEGVDLLLGSRETNIYTLSIGDMMASFPIGLLSKASKTKSWLCYRRLSHLNFGAINHLAKNGLGGGLPKLKFEKDHLCSACAIGKSKKQSHKPKSKDTNQEKLYLLQMDLCGPMRVASINGKKYILVIMDDYSRFTWVKFLSSKDKTPDFIIKFLKMIQVRLNATVRNICTDNGTEFVN